MAYGAVTTVMSALDQTDYLGRVGGKHGGVSNLSIDAAISNIGNQNVKDKNKRAIFNVIDPGGGLSNTFGFTGRKSKAPSEADIFGDMTLNEQAKAMAMLSHFADTGQFGAYQAGEVVPGAMGEYQLDPLEAEGTQAIQDIFRGGERDITKLGVKEIMDLLSTDKYDPTKGGVYQGMKRNILREQTEQQDKLAQLQSMSGSLRSTGFERESGLLGERTSNKLSDIIAQMYDQYANKRLAGAETAVSFGSEQQRAELERANEAREAGAVQRLLKDSYAKAQYNDWLRGRREQQSQIDVAQTLFSKGATPISVATSGGGSDSTNYGEAIGNVMNIVSMFKGGGGAKGAGASTAGSSGVSSNFSLGNNSLSGNYSSSIRSSGGSGFLS